MIANEGETINRRYLLNIGDDPSKVLEPIWGYAHLPLVPLEEACKSLHNIISRLEPHIWVALENSKNPSDNLTQDESAAIYLYTMEWDSSDVKPIGSLYRHLNHALKQTDRSNLKPWFKYLKLLLTALAKIPISHHSVIWRGVHRDYSAVYIPGTRVTWWPFSSCTTSLNVLESDLYLGNVGKRTLFSIEPLNGRTIRAHSRFKTEDEIILLPGTYLEVVSCLNPAPDLHIIHLRQSQPPFDLLEPPFEDAVLLPPSVNRNGSNFTIKTDDDLNVKSHPWYKKKKIIVSCAIILMLIIIAIILGVVLGSRKTNHKTFPIAGLTTTRRSPTFNASARIAMAWESNNWNVRNELNTNSQSSNWTSNNVILDAIQGLYMRLTRDSTGNWWCSEVETQQVYSFGSFTVFINASIDQFDPNVVLRIFTKNTVDKTNQIIVEIGSRKQIIPTASNLWYTVYPNVINGTINSEDTRMPTLGGTYTTHRINWTSSLVTFTAEYDHNYSDFPSRRFNFYSTNSSWASFVPKVPAPICISLCTYNGSAPINGKEVEINIRRVFWNKF
ncbi:unnamed protein product [Adineta steineri]|uniref:NAD(P)(+)--arginine ADP-ribosyltransferase n=1 Tax=Adineta steineri TaxID=433720 RepID=A0A813P382_9BILA|nr:unnamed protein product [Adineta steineri]